jgi:hypothetical protein
VLITTCRRRGENKKYEYIELTYRLGVITATAPNAISMLRKI